MSIATTRRQALGRAALGACGLAGAASVPSLARPAPARAQAADDEALRDFLVPAIALEQLSVLAYDTATDAGGDLRTTLELFRDQEQAHANALRRVLDSLGFDLPDAPDAPADTAVFDDVEGLSDEAADDPARALADRLSRLLSELGGLERERELLDYLGRLEEEQIRYYLDSGPGLESEDLARTSVEILGNQAQHLVVLRQAQGDSPADAVAQVEAAAS